jgi:hypothetical protein
MHVQLRDVRLGPEAAADREHRLLLADSSDVWSAIIGMPDADAGPAAVPARFAALGRSRPARRTGATAATDLEAGDCGHRERGN